MKPSKLVAKNGALREPPELRRSNGTQQNIYATGARRGPFHWSRSGGNWEICHARWVRTVPSKWVLPLEIGKLVAPINSDEASSNGDLPMKCGRWVVPIGPARRPVNSVPIGSAEPPAKCVISMKFGKLPFPLKSAESLPIA